MRWRHHGAAMASRRDGTLNSARFLPDTPSLNAIVSAPDTPSVIETLGENSAQEDVEENCSIDAYIRFGESSMHWLHRKQQRQFCPEILQCWLPAQT